MKTSGFLVGVLVFLFVLLVISSAVSAGTKTLTFQEGDGGAYSNTQGATVGWLPNSAGDGSGDHLFVSVDVVVLDFAPGKRSFLSFPDIIGSNEGQIPAGSTIESASLQLTRIVNSTHGALVRMVTEAWDENTITSDNVPSYSADVLPSFPPGIPEQVHVVDITSTVQAWASGTSNFGVALVVGLVLVEFSESFYSDDAADVAKRPKLTVTFTSPLAPVEPSTWGKVKALYR